MNQPRSAQAYSRSDVSFSYSFSLTRSAIYHWNEYKLHCISFIYFNALTRPIEFNEYSSRLHAIPAKYFHVKIFKIGYWLHFFSVFGTTETLSCICLSSRKIYSIEWESEIKIWLNQ